MRCSGWRWLLQPSGRLADVNHQTHVDLALQSSHVDTFVHAYCQAMPDAWYTLRRPLTRPSLTTAGWPSLPHIHTLRCPGFTRRHPLRPSLHTACGAWPPPGRPGSARRAWV